MRCYLLPKHLSRFKIVSEEVHPIEICQKEHVFDYERIYLNSDDPLVDELSDVYVRSQDITVWIDPLDATQEFTGTLELHMRFL